MTDDTTKPPRRNRRKEAKERTAAKVKAAAKLLFETVGYERATIRDIAAEAGMSTGAIFANYEDKAALYRAAYGFDPITPEQGVALATALRAFVLNKSDMALSPTAHEGCSGAFERLFSEAAGLVASTIAGKEGIVLGLTAAEAKMVKTVFDLFIGDDEEAASLAGACETAPEAVEALIHRLEVRA